MEINLINILNFIFYVINIIITYGIGNAGWANTPDNGELSEKYQTLITPNGSAFSIWGLIFVAEGIFAVAQLFPKFSNEKMVMEGVKYWWVLACIFQCGWTIAFAFEVIWLSLVFMLLIWSSLAALLYSQYYTESKGTLLEFWLLRFPFAVHCGWLTAASALNVNVVVVDIDQPADIQLACGIISLAVLHAISVWVVFGLQKPNYTIAVVLAWANYFIYVELEEPKQTLLDSGFSSDTLSGVRYAAVAVSCIILLQIVIRIPTDIYARKFKKQEPQQSDEVTNKKDEKQEGAPVGDDV
ncbi:unnamed protein product [Cylindrotheca closterium]|uniref:Uncharacterized protein n=1 Tax=Cylindrotheca closterium TaxID=2856 RepID=A0AAD2CNW2_9STRA|nr:unnamed protein product [Cylindrotheca closterium]